MESTLTPKQPRELNNHYSSLIGKNLGALIRAAGISQSQLVSELEARGYTVNQGNLSKYLAGKPNSQLGLLMEIADILHVSLDKLVSPNFDPIAAARLLAAPDGRPQPETPCLRLPIQGRAFVTDPKAPEFLGYLQTYHVYMLSPVSSDRTVVSGRLILEPDGNICKATLSFDPNQQTEVSTSAYVGQAIISKSLSLIHILLANSNTGEFHTISFRHFLFRSHPQNQQHLHCRIAVMLTNGSGEFNSPTVCRMILSCDEIRPEHITLLAPHLHLNSGDISIHNQSLTRLSMTSDRYRELIDCLTRFGAVKTYCWSEEFVLGFGKLYLTEQELPAFLSEIRDVSIKSRFNKASRRADHVVRELLVSLGYFSA